MVAPRWHRGLWALALGLTAQCGAKTALREPDVASADDAADAVTDVARVDAGCVPRPEVCNHIDDDCNGLVDDIDRGGDGIPDCLRIALFGNEGTFSSSNFQRWLTNNGASVTRTQTANEPVTRALLDRFDVIILDELIRTYSGAEAQTMRDWVDAGGGLMSLSGYVNQASDRDRPDSLLAPFGLRYVDGLLDQPVTDFTPHPTTQGLRAVPFSGGYRVELAPGAPSGSTVSIARLPQGVVAMVQDRGRGRVYVWGDEWVEFDSQWSTMPMIPRFWGNALGWLAHLR